MLYGNSSFTKVFAFLIVKEIEIWDLTMDLKLEFYNLKARALGCNFVMLEGF